MPALEINDAIHQTIKLYGREEAIVDHPYLQRLRSIRQLGFVSLVYPSATHDRFSHTLGTVYVATLLARQILYDDSQSVLARVLSEKEKIFFIRNHLFANRTFYIYARYVCKRLFSLCCNLQK